jgi:hypothetical protein
VGDAMARTGDEFWRGESTFLLGPGDLDGDGSADLVIAWESDLLALLDPMGG